MTSTWQLTHPIDTIVFDCDGTLSAIEGIDELARNSGHHQEVEALTADAMGHCGMNLELYKRRLDLVKPNYQAICDLGQKYYQHRIEDIDKIIQLFLRLKKNIYILSAGLLPSVRIFGKSLHINEKNIYAVDVQFNHHNEYLDFDRSSPLVTSNGKRILINELKSMHQNLIFVGDGLNDLAAADLVNRFIGYGGIYYRENIASQCQYYIKSTSMSPLLPLSLTDVEYHQLEPHEKLLYDKGIAKLLSA